MRVRREAPAVPLSSELTTILLFGPVAAGKTLRDLDHDQLRALWRVHGPTLLASKGCPRQPWFPQRDLFVTFIRRDLL